ncbi:hypothetical protein GCM10017673_34740 [Streptosporangium violaceochromogenes]|nr:hypothetical protein GCM10017673_34740 [Streptosporangium violaceochromogenes]
MSFESIKPVPGGPALGRRVAAGGFLTAAILVVPAVFSCGDVALASAAGTASGATGARPAAAVVRVDGSPAVSYPAPTPPPAPGAREPETREPGSREQGGREQGTREPGSREPGNREPGTREPGSREQGGREPGAREPGSRQPGGRQPGGRPRNPGGRGAESVNAPENGGNGGREAGRGGGRGRDTGRSGLDTMRDLDAQEDVEATDGRSGKIIKKPAAGWGRTD